MRPIYNPIHTSSKPKNETQSNKQPPAAPNSPGQNSSVVQNHSDAPQASLVGAPALGQEVQPKAKLKPLVFRDVSDQDLKNLINNEETFSHAMQNGSIFGMRSPNANALAAACRLQKFGFAIQLLGHPLAEEAFLEDTAGIANILARLDLMNNYDESKLKSFLRTLIQGVNIQKIEEYFSEKKQHNSIIPILVGLSQFFTYNHDNESLKKLLFSIKKADHLQCCEASLELFHGRINAGNILQSLECILEAGIKPSKEWCHSVLLNRMGTCSLDHLVIFEMLTAFNHKNLISKEDNIERDVLLKIYKKTQERTLLDCAFNLLNYTHKRKINILKKEEKKEIIHQVFFSIISSFSYDEKDIPAELKDKTEKLFESIEVSEAKDVFNAELINHFFTRIPRVMLDWKPLQAEYVDWILDRMISTLGEEHFINCIETSSLLRKVVECLVPNPLKIKSLIQRGANPMVKIDSKTYPDPLLNLGVSLDIQRCLAQSQHPEYKAFVLSTMFGLKSAGLLGSNPASSVPIIEKGFEAFLEAFPSKLDSAVIDRIQKAYIQSVRFDKRQDLLKHFAESPREPDTIQLAYLDADSHTYAYVMYQDMLIETQRSEEDSMLANDNQLFYMTNATAFDGEKVRAIQMLPIDKAEARNLIEQSNSINDYHLRFGKDTVGFCQKHGTPIKDLGPLLEHLGLETSFSTITDPLQQKKVALGEIFQSLGYLEKDGSGAILDTFKDKDSAELVQNLVQDTDLDPQTLTTWLENPSLSKIDFLKKALDILGITQKKLYYVSDADRQDPLAAIAFEKTPQKTGNCYFASPMLNFGALMWWATVLERTKQQNITVTREHVGQNPEFYKAIYKEVEPTYKELVRFMKLNAWEDYQQQFGKLSNPEMQAELEAKVAKLKSPSYLQDSEEEI